MVEGNKSQSAQEFVSYLEIYSARLIVDDYFWQLFGYQKRPRRGAWFNKFVDQEKLNQETFLLRELFVISTCISVKSFDKIPDDLQVKMLRKLLDDFLPKSGIYEAFRFETLNEADMYFVDGMNEYLSCDIHSYLLPFKDRGTKILGEKFNGGWLVGLARMQQDINLPNILKDNFISPLIDDI